MYGQILISFERLGSEGSAHPFPPLSLRQTLQEVLMREFGHTEEGDSFGGVHARKADSRCCVLPLSVVHDEACHPCPHFCFTLTSWTETPRHLILRRLLYLLFQLGVEKDSGEKRKKDPSLRSVSSTVSSDPDEIPRHAARHVNTILGCYTFSVRIGSKWTRDPRSSILDP